MTDGRASRPGTEPAKRRRNRWPGPGSDRRGRIGPGGSEALPVAGLLLAAGFCIGIVVLGGLHGWPRAMARADEADATAEPLASGVSLSLVCRAAAHAGEPPSVHDGEPPSVHVYTAGSPPEGTGGPSGPNAPTKASAVYWEGTTANKNLIFNCTSDAHLRLLTRILCAGPTMAKRRQTSGPENLTTSPQSRL